MDRKQYLDNYHLRRADRDRHSDHRQHGQKEEAGQVDGMQLRQLQKLSDVRLLSQTINTKQLFDKAAQKSYNTNVKTKTSWISEGSLSFFISFYRFNRFGSCKHEAYP